MSFATELEKHVARLGIVQRGALAILSETRPKTKKAGLPVCVRIIGPQRRSTLASVNNPH